MRKSIIAAAAWMCAAVAAQAGGYLTNTNQSVAFLRNPARNAFIAVDGAYTNPAGVGFLSKGWHMGFNLQSAYQTRTATSTFGTDVRPFAFGTVNGVKNPGSGVKEFKGEAKAPVIPSIDLVRVADDWFFSFHFGITGGGGKCGFNDGLGSFESQVAMLPVMVNAIQPGAVSGYGIDTHVEGRQYYFGGQLGVGYKITPRFNMSVGGRVVYAQTNYYGYVRNMNLAVNTPGGTVMMPAGEFFEQAGYPHFAALTEDRELNCDQNGWGFTPIISAHYDFGRLDVSARYEFKTRLRLENKSGVNTSGLAEFDDGRFIPADIPAILSLGAKYDIMPSLRASAGFHYYFDEQATQFENREEALAGGGWEVLAGMEYDINDRFTVSAGWQTTNYGLGDNSKFISDMSFVTNSNSVGVGARIKIKERIHLNVAYFKTFYQHYNKKMDDYNNLKETFAGMLEPMGQQLAAGAANCQAILNNPLATEAQKVLAQQQLAVIQNEVGAMNKVAGGLASFSTAGSDNFHRTNDVFGLSMDITF